MPQITVLVADDDRSTRTLVRRVLAPDGSIVVVAEAENGRQAVEFARMHQPDVVIMDVQMPVLNGHAATAEILAAHPHIRIVMHSSSTTHSDLDLAFANGAVGFVAKTKSHELRDAVCAASRGRMFFSP